MTNVIVDPAYVLFVNEFHMYPIREYNFALL